jgi:hypothetical protein
MQIEVHKTLIVLDLQTMTSCIRGYYSPSASELNVFEETNRKITDSIREAYPTGITALELA